jgi:maleamate amidohydrolase
MHSAALQHPAPRIGFGKRPAVLIVDFARAWTDAASPLSIPLDPQIEATRMLLSVARDAAVPIIYTTVAYDDADLDAVPMLRKTPRVQALLRGTWPTEIDPRIAPADADLVLAKKHASSFFGTSLISHLVTHGVDTLLICGCITSGCVRASAVDAAQHGLRALIIEEAVGDRFEEAHRASLRSIDELYGDVVSLPEAISALKSSS